MSTYQDEKKYSSLARALKDADYAIIDTCSLMEDSFPEFLDILEETKKEYLEPSFPVYVLESSVEELNKHAKNKEKKDKKIAATQAVRILTKAKKKKTVEIIKASSSSRSEGWFGRDKNEDDYYFADAEIIAKVTLDRTKYNIVVITQDKKLASDLINLSRSQAVYGSKVHVYKLNENAMLVENKGEERVAPSKKAGSSVLLKEASKQPQKSKAQSETKGPTPRQSHRPDPNELLNKVIAGDKRIHANLSNANYSKEKMLKDLKAQQSDMQKVPLEKIAAAHLSHNLESIAYEIKKIEHPEQLKLPAPIPQKQPEPAKKVSKKEGKEALWYEYGQTIEEAFRNVANHYGVMFRDPGVPYVPGIHGPLNFTSEDLAKISATYGNTLKENQRNIKQYRSVYLMAEKTQKGIKAWIDLNGFLAPKPAPTEPAPQPSKQAKANQPAKDEKVVTIVEEDAPVKANEEQTKKQSRKKASKKTEPVTNEKTAEKDEKPAKAELNVSKEAGETVQKEQPAKKPSKKESPATEAKAAKPKKKTHLEETIEFDEKLKANINNPNYQKEAKVKDVTDQIARVKKIPLKDRSVLHFDLNALKTFLALLG